MTARPPFLSPSDVFSRPVFWEQVSREKACTIAMFQPIVVVSANQTAFRSADWFKPDAPFAQFRASQGYPMESLRYYRFRGGSIERANANTNVAADPLDLLRGGAAPEAEKRVCEATSLEYSSGKRKPKGDVLHVVAKEGAKVTLTAQLKGGCGSHPVWAVSRTHKDGSKDEKKLSGMNATLPLDPWDYKKLSIWKAQPELCDVALEACDGATKYGKVMVWPRDELEVKFSRSPSERGGIFAFLGDWKVEAQVKPNGDGVNLATKADEKYKRDKDAFVSVLKRVGGALGLPVGDAPTPAERTMLAKKAGGDSEIEVLNPFNLEFKGNWQDKPNDNTVFFQYELGANITLFQGSYQLEFGPLAAIPAKIKKWTTDYLGDVKLYVKFSGEITVGGKVARKEAGKVEGGLNRRGEVGVRVGANLFLLSKSLVNFDVNGSTKIEAEVQENFVATPPNTEIEVRWGGIVGTFTIEAAFGLVARNYQATFVDAGSLWKYNYPPQAD